MRQGHFSGLLCFGYDITTQKRSEIELQSAKEAAEASDSRKKRLFSQHEP